jgi:hypothetical protein
MASIIEFKEIRGWVLKVLYNALPAFVGDQSLSTCLQQCNFDVSPLQIQGHLRYLSEKGYVELCDSGLEDIGLVRHSAKLTSKGVDFVEGNLPDDPGITRK